MALLQNLRIRGDLSRRQRKRILTAGHKIDPLQVRRWNALVEHHPRASVSHRRDWLEAHANEHREWRIYADFAQVLIAAARDLYRDEPFGVELSETVYAWTPRPSICACRFSRGENSAAARAR